MNILFFCPRWGSEHLSWDDFMAAVKSAGYDGVEYAIAANVPEKELDNVWAMADRHGLKIIAQHYDTYEPDFIRHCDAYQAWLDRIKPYPVVKIDSQTGKDYFTFEQNRTLITLASMFSAETGVAVYHETHRNKFPFAAHITKRYLHEIPELKITLDVSHWVNVAESYLEDQSDAMALAIRRTGHIHARVGYPEGPQVPDPRAPEWQTALQIHLNWWDKVIKRHRSEGVDGDVMTVTPEFGPYPYMVETPFTRQPLANQWDINMWMMRLLRERYAGPGA